MPPRRNLVLAKHTNDDEGLANIVEEDDAPKPMMIIEDYSAAPTEAAAPVENVSFKKEEDDDDIKHAKPDIKIASTKRGSSAKSKCKEADRVKLYEKIKRYQASYEIFRNLQVNSNSSYADLEKVYDHINGTLNAGGGSDIIKTGYGISLKLWEKGTLKAGLKTQGLHDLVMNPQSPYQGHIDKICKQLSCEFGGISKMPPITQLMLITGLATSHVHSKNASAEVLQEFMNKKPDENLVAQANAI